MVEFPPTLEQERILGHDYRNHGRILAGPGTGKSTTTVNLVKRLLSGENPPKLKLLTFTRAATAELCKKTLDCDAAVYTRPSTIHSFAISVLLRNPGTGGFPEPLRIPDSWEYDNIVRRGLGVRAGFRLSKIDSLVREMASNWESLVPREELAVTDEERAKFLGVWREHREIFGYTLLQELPSVLRRALRDHDDLEGLDYDLLVVDEYQDLNACDLEVLKCIADRGCSLIAVGDDDQSIYSFRRAHPEGIRRFIEDYPGANDYPLSTTLRCGSRIVAWSRHVILGDPNRPRTRSIPTALPGSPEGEVALLSFRGNQSEARGIATIVHNLIEKENIPPQEILILMRGDHNGTFSSPIRQELEAKGIECADQQYVKRLLEEEPNRRFLEFMHLLVNREDPIAWAGLVHLTSRIGPIFFKYIYDRCVRNRTRFGTELLSAQCEDFAGGPSTPSRTANILIKSVLLWLKEQTIPPKCPEEGWGSWILSLSGTEILPNPTDQFKALLRDLDELAEPDQELGRFLSQIEPLGKDLTLARCDGGRMMTMTGSKGLTVTATIIAGLEEGIVPRPDNQLSEERRILYVAMTRARKFLYGTWAGVRRGPTARAGTPSKQRRTVSAFLEGGPVASQPGAKYFIDYIATGGRLED